MNRVKFFLEITLVPVYFVALLAVNIKNAVYETYWDVVDAYRGTKYKYGIK
jgi:hypothetical protein